MATKKKTATKKKASKKKAKPSGPAPAKGRLPYRVALTESGVRIKVNHVAPLRPTVIELDLGAIPPDAIREALDLYEQAENSQDD